MYTPISLTTIKTICIVKANICGFEFRMGEVVNFILSWIKETWYAFTLPFYYHLGDYAFFWTIVFHLEDYSTAYAAFGLLSFVLYVLIYRSDSLLTGFDLIRVEVNYILSLERSPLSAVSYTLTLLLRIALWVYNTK